MVAVATVWWIQTGGVFAQSKLQLNTGAEIYRAACVACHGPDGKGTPETTAGFERPATFPDFSDCNSSTREANVQWRSIVHNGGPARGFSEIMPSFTEALTPEQINKVIQHLRGFCKDPAWPRGELNLPRAMATEKAFPEDEAVLTADINTRGGPAMANKLVYERRFGVRNQFEMNLPFSFQHQDSGSWLGGVGDIVLGYKRPIFSSIRTGSIFSLSGEVTLPTGNKARGQGNGVTVLEGFGAYGQLLPGNSFLQVQSGFEAPTHSGDANKAAFVRTALGKSMSQGKGGLGRTWSPMVEVVADREFATGERVNWDVIPQVQVTLSKRQHIRASIGYRIPVNDYGSRIGQVMFYLLWDWFDGGIRDGWR